MFKLHYKLREMLPKKLLDVEIDPLIFLSDEEYLPCGILLCLGLKEYVYTYVYAAGKKTPTI